ncbi:ATP-binding protein [Thermodesulfobacteriota bacterium]
MAEKKRADPADRGIYEKLRRHYNESPASRLHHTKEILEILEILFTPEQAAYANALPLRHQGGITPEDLGKTMGSEIGEVEAMLASMAGEGTVYGRTNKRDGKKSYSLWSLYPGTLENIYAVNIEDDRRRRLSKLFNKYFKEGAWAASASEYPILRVIPVNETLAPTSEVLSYEDVSKIIANASIMTVIPCACRSKASAKCDHILEADIVMGNWAEYLIEYRGARQWNREEVLQRLRECEQDGLVHLAQNTQQGCSVICNCCPCCCAALRGLVKFHNPRTFARSNYMAQIDHEKCTLCLSCKKICPMEAVARIAGFETDGSDTRVIVEAARCIGCGLCSSVCPVDAVDMKKVRDHVPAEDMGKAVRNWIQGSDFSAL